MILGMEKNSDFESDISIILCVDNSGSMSITTEVNEKMNLKHGLTEEEFKMLKGFIEPGAEKFQYLPSQKRKKNVSWVSRKQCVLGAIETQLNEMSVSHPNRKMGLVTFNNDVAIIGDGKGEPKFIAGDKLNKWQVFMSEILFFNFITSGNHQCFPFLRRHCDERAPQVLESNSSRSVQPT